MYHVFFENKVIIFTDSIPPSASAGEVAELPAGAGIGIAKVLEKLENNKRLYIKTPSPGEVFSDFSAGFVQLAAAGGLVTNAHGDCLMIVRKGYWDLPKGHVDGCERIEECAVREVMEECGLTYVTVGEPITETLHIYPLGSRWAMKRTSWFRMTSGQRELTPQADEGIVRAEWVARRYLADRLSKSYMTIRAVFEAAGAFRHTNSNQS